MRKTEILRQSADSLNETRLERLAGQLETLRQTEHQNAQALAATLEPLAQAMAALKDETRQTLTEIDSKSREQIETSKQKIGNSARAWNNAAAEAKRAADRLNKAGQLMKWTHYALAALTVPVTAVLIHIFGVKNWPPFRSRPRQACRMRF